MADLSAELMHQFKSALGPDGVVQDSEIIAPHLQDWRDNPPGHTPVMLQPQTTDEVAAILRLCQQTGTIISVQGGNTGLVGGQTPQGEVLLSLRRLNQIRALHPEDGLMIAEAGVTLDAAQQAAAHHDLRLTVDLASSGTATLGGMIATNAGGVMVLRHGMMRDQVAGLEVVLPTGEIWRDLRGLKKDNTGWDFKQLFVGSEGTLGVVTAAAVRLKPQPVERVTALVAVERLADALTLYGDMDAHFGPHLEAVELIPAIGLEFVGRHMPDVPQPFTSPPPWSVLLEFTNGTSGLAAPVCDHLAQRWPQTVLAQTDTQRQNLWALREHLSAAQKPEGGSWKFDIAIPRRALVQFVEAAYPQIERLCPGARPVTFGHIGDGNLHFNVSQPVGMDPATFKALYAQATEVVYDLVQAHEGSIAAEHGVGVMKGAAVAAQKPAIELALWRQMRHVFDPKGILNPRVLF